MWGLTKRPTTGESTEIILKVPNDIADQMTVLVRNIMDMARRNDEDIDDDALYPIEDVIGPTTPGDLLQGLRGREGLTQAEFAEKLGVRQNYISDMERNVRPISKAMAKKIGKTFDIDYTLFL